MLRALKEADLYTVVTIESLTQFKPWSFDVFKKCLQEHYPCWVICIEQEVVGFIIISVKAGEAHVLNFGVHPQFQRQGLGGQLMTHAMQWATEMEASLMYLEVRRSNKSAINLYRKMNFKEIAARKNYYLTLKGQEDALVFAIDLCAG